MKKLLIIGHNINSAGITAQTVNLIKELNGRYDRQYTIILPDHEGFSMLKKVQCKGVRILYVKYPQQKILRLLTRLYYEIFYLPILTLKINPQAVLALANYLPTPTIFRKKIVLIRHPYLLKKDLSGDAPVKKKLNENFTRFLLKLTLYTTDLVIVQSEYMRMNFSKNFKSSAKVVVLPNPLSNVFNNKTNNTEQNQAKERDMGKSINYFYPSRFYPHKNHIFILKLVKKFHKELINLNINIIITLGSDSITYAFNHEKQIFNNMLREIQKAPYNKVIKNIGEVSQHKLAQYYQKSNALFFPSSEETFGNGLIEGMFFELPIVVPDLDYAKAICGNAGLYYQEDNIDTAFNLLKKLATDVCYQSEKSKLSKRRFENFIHTDEWVNTLNTYIEDLD